MFAYLSEQSCFQDIVFRTLKCPANLRASRSDTGICKRLSRPFVARTLCIFREKTESSVDVVSFFFSSWRPFPPLHSAVGGVPLSLVLFTLPSFPFRKLAGHLRAASMTSCMASSVRSAEETKIYMRQKTRHQRTPVIRKPCRRCLCASGAAVALEETHTSR